MKHRINVSALNVSIDDSIFQSLSDDNGLGVFVIEENTILINKCLFNNIIAKSATVLYAFSAIARIHFCCFEELKTTLHGEWSAATISRLDHSQFSLLSCSSFLCSPKESEGGDSPFLIIRNCSSFDYFNSTKCFNKVGCLVAGVKNTANVAISYSELIHCCNDAFGESGSKLSTSNYINNSVLYFGCGSAFFNNCFFYNNEKVTDVGQISYTNCTGDYPQSLDPFFSISLYIEHIFDSCFLFSNKKKNISINPIINTLRVIILLINSLT